MCLSMGRGVGRGWSHPLRCGRIRTPSAWFSPCSSGSCRCLLVSRPWGALCWLLTLHERAGSSREPQPEDAAGAWFPGCREEPALAALGRCCCPQPRALAGPGCEHLAYRSLRRQSCCRALSRATCRETVFQGEPSPLPESRVGSRVGWGHVSHRAPHRPDAGPRRGSGNGAATSTWAAQLDEG